MKTSLLKSFLALMIIFFYIAIIYCCAEYGVLVGFLFGCYVVIKLMFGQSLYGKSLKHETTAAQGFKYYDKYDRI